MERFTEISISLEFVWISFFQGGGMITAITANDIDSLLEGFAPFMISLMCLAKYINFFYNFKQVSLPSLRKSLVSKLTLTFTWITQMKRLLDIMREDWEIYKKLRNEYDLLCEQYAIGKKITISFVGKATLQLAIQRLKVINTVSISYVLTF